MSILIIDDSPTSRKVLRSYLEREGIHDIAVADSAAEAFRLLRLAEGPAAPVPPFEVILMDVEMPEMGGFEACRRIQGQERLRDIPIIVVTAHAETRYLEEAFASGARDYLPKPVRAFELLARVRAAMGLKQEMDARKARERELLELKNELEKANLALSRLAVEDPLTAIPNRRSFDLRLEAEWRHHRRKQQPLTLAMIDVDHFKAYNDLHGHQEGDRALRSVARALTSVVGRAGDLVARYGGEEFAAILPETPAPGAVHIAERFRVAVESLTELGGDAAQPRRVTVSVGVATLVPGRGDPAAKLLAAADAALYGAKSAGRNCVRNAGAHD